MVALKTRVYPGIILQWKMDLWEIRGMNSFHQGRARFKMGPVIKPFKLLREKMDLLSLRLGFLCPKLSTQGAITCSPKLHYPVSLDQPANSFLRSTDSTLEVMDLPQAAYNLWTHQGRLGLLWPCLGYAHLLSLLRDSISVQPSLGTEVFLPLQTKESPPCQAKETRGAVKPISSWPRKANSFLAFKHGFFLPLYSFPNELQPLSPGQSSLAPRHLLNGLLQPGLPVFWNPWVSHFFHTTGSSAWPLLNLRFGIS